MAAVKEEESFVVEAKNMTGTVYKVTCSSSDTVLSLKERISQQADCPVACIRLMQRKKHLKDNAKTLADYGIEGPGPVKLTCPIRLMNVITPERIRGAWIWVCFGGGSQYRFYITGNPIRYSSHKGCRWELLEIGEDGFGFKSSQCTYKPTTIRPNLTIIKFTRNNDDSPSNTSFWVKHIDETVREELEKVYGTCTFPDMEAEIYNEEDHN